MQCHADQWQPRTRNGTSIRLLCGGLAVLQWHLARLSGLSMPSRRSKQYGPVAGADLSTVSLYQHARVLVAPESYALLPRAAGFACIIVKIW